MRKKHLYEYIQAAQSEAELVHLFSNYFDLTLSTKNYIDLYTEQILYEFKLNDNLKNLQIRAKTAAQALYYVRKLKLGDDMRTPSNFICLVSKNSATVIQTELLADFFNNPNYSWRLKPSNPCKKLVADLAECDIIVRARVFDLANFNDCLDFEIFINNNRKRKSSISNVKKKINAHNFYQVFQYWQSFFGADVTNGHKPSEYFLIDIERGKSSVVDNNSVIFRMTNGEIREKLLNPDAYNYFWSQYDKISSAHEIIAIRSKIDILTEINLRRRTGEFYTPLDFAEIAFDYLMQTADFDKNYRIWDMAAGTGNLEFAILKLKPDAIKYCYMSTLIADEADYCKQIFSDATVFQYDYLNDGAEKLSKKLRDDLNNPDIRWIIFINPPYATASNYERDPNRKNKENVSMTVIRELMNAENMGAASRELYVQFLYRISRDFANRTAYLGIFCATKYINSNNNQPFRDKIFRYKYERGFVFSSQNFDGCKGKFPVSFIVWNLGERIPIEEQEILLDVYEKDDDNKRDFVKTAEKTLRPARNEEFLNKWVKRPPNIKKFPPMTGALNIARNKKIPCDKIPEGFLGGIMCWNDFTHHDFTALLSAPYGTAGGMSITAENFEQYLIMHAVHRIPKLTWLNRNDQFLQPQKELNREFISDAVIWSLFASSNQTVSLRNVEYAGEVYQIANNFYPFELSEVRSWECSSLSIAARLETATEDRFAALWIKNNPLSAQAQAVLNAGRAIYKKFYTSLNKLDVQKWKIEDWDAGWYQIRMSLSESVDLSALGAKLLPQIYELGFLRDEVRYF